MNRLLLGVAVVAVALAAAMMVLDRPKQGDLQTDTDVARAGAETDVKDTDATEIEPLDVSRRPAVEAPQETSKIDAPDASSPALQPDTPSGHPFRLPMDDAFFEAEYRGWDSDALEAEAERVLGEYMAAQKKAFAAMKKAGRYEFLEKGPDGEPDFDGFSNATLYTAGVTPEHPGEVYVITLPFGEFAGIYDLGDRWNWLNHAKDR